MLDAVWILDARYLILDDRAGKKSGFHAIEPLWLFMGYFVG